MRGAQFNDGLGWRGNREVPADATTEQAIEFAKEHYARFPHDHLRIIEQESVGDGWSIVWWQDGKDAEEHQGAI
jgi:hypothetical protein